MSKKEQHTFNTITEDLVFTSSAEDFVTYDEVQKAALTLGISVPTRDEIDCHMKTYFKCLPTKRQQREGFEYLSFIQNGVVENALHGKEISNSNSTEKQTEEPVAKRRCTSASMPQSLLSTIKKWHDVNRQTSHGLTAKLEQVAKDKIESRHLKKEIFKLTTQEVAMVTTKNAVNLFKLNR